MNDATLFDFENDFVVSLRCIPMAVRFKLDRSEVKLSLKQWSGLSVEDRRSLLLSPCDSPYEIKAYRKRLIGLLAARFERGPTPLPVGSTVGWDALAQTPEQVRDFAATKNVTAPSDIEWGRLTDLQRFTLLKLSRDNHDNVNFVPALAEFGLLQRGPPSRDAPSVARSS